MSTAISNFETFCVRALSLALVTKCHREGATEPSQDAIELFRDLKNRVRGNRSSLTATDHRQILEAVFRTSYELVSEAEPPEFNL